MFATPIEFEVTIDEDSEDGLFVNGIKFPISEDGTFGPDFLGATTYELRIEGNELRLESSLINLPGPSLFCFIIVNKI